MIPRANITAWRKSAPWPDNTQVEQDLVLSRALVGRRMCKACNTGMTDIDQHVGDNAVVSMMRVANTPAGSMRIITSGGPAPTHPVRPS